MGFSLQQFSEVFKIRDATGQPYILIGGQAVNYWAERYLSTEPQLKPLQPFTSEDIDSTRHVFERSKPPRGSELKVHGGPEISFGSHSQRVTLRA